MKAVAVFPAKREARVIDHPEPEISSIVFGRILKVNESRSD
jgi:hypothetical protein